MTTTVTIGWIADDTTFGARLALVRQRMTWSNVAEAAQQCGLQPESWRRWEYAGMEPRRMRTVVAQIAGVAGCDPQWLMWGPRKWGARDSNPEPTGLGVGHLVAIAGEALTRRGRGRPVGRTHPLPPPASNRTDDASRSETGQPNGVRLRTVGA